MIVGHGDIAQTLIKEGLDQPDVTFFASGVSNSKCINPLEYLREKETLINQSTFKHLVYFSSLCQYYSDSTYATHKIDIERIIKRCFVSHTIIRLGNITWGNNPNTIINYFKILYAAGKVPELQDTYRHIISREEFVYWMKNIRPGINDIMNIPGEFIHVKEIWRRVQNGEY